MVRIPTANLFCRDKKLFNKYMNLNIQPLYRNSGKISKICDEMLKGEQNKGNKLKFHNYILKLIFTNVSSIYDQFYD